MAKIGTIVCPVSNETANENIVRSIAFYTVIASALSLYLNSFAISFILAIDFFLRAFTNGNLSWLKHIAKQTVTLLKLPAKSIRLAPKKFAASLGFVFSLVLGTCQVFQLHTISLTVGGLLIACAVLESTFSICIGCYVYTFLLKFQKNKNKN